MDILRGLDAQTYAHPTTVTVGVFDGVHRGHAAILGRVVAEAKRLAARPAVVTFDPHPLEVLAPDRMPCLLTTIEQRLGAFAAAGIAVTLVLDFDDRVRALEPADFVERVLVGTLEARKVVVGEDFHFGHDRSGDPNLLADLGKKFGFEEETIDLVGDGKIPKISSSDIRRHLGAGEIDAVADLLGRPYRLAGRVVRGDERGRSLGFPTANIGPHDKACLPGNGVYAGWWIQDEKKLPGVINVGVRPTFKPSDRPLCEIHLFDFDGDLYGATGQVEFTAFLRPEMRFDGPDALIAQIRQDADQAHKLLSG